jgi:hypothetical protein
VLWPAVGMHGVNINSLLLFSPFVIISQYYPYRVAIHILSSLVGWGVGGLHVKGEET